ncbi:hypothetical protein EOD39_12831 [Acipenser ruthenus]|uniref:Uncharacterized protein n=1 Tax=Acipenser ruthenus TaxID=7906 RepID=A0A662YRW3_ACIRT|nr:hypothetical protein EOD39_12831 [Acipenser ruthenus]
MDQTMQDVNTEEDTQWDPREPGSPEAEAPVGSRQCVLSWRKVTPIVKTLWTAEREGPLDSGSQRHVSSQPESGSLSSFTPLSEKPQAVRREPCLKSAPDYQGGLPWNSPGHHLPEPSCCHPHCGREETTDQGRGEQNAAACSEPTTRLTPGSHTEVALPVPSISTRQRGGIV